MSNEPRRSPSSGGAKKVGIHLEAPLGRKLTVRAEAAGLSEGQMAEQLLKESLEATAVLSSQAELHRLAEEVENLKLAVESLRAEVATTLGEEANPDKLKPLLQELRDDIATAIRAALSLAGHPPEKVDAVMNVAFPGAELKPTRAASTIETP